MMKYFSIIIFIIFLFACKKDSDLEADLIIKSDVTIKGIVAYVDNSPMKNDTLIVSFSDEQDTIFLTTIPLPLNEPPVSLDKVKLEIEGDHGAVITPTSPFIVDLNSDKTFQVTAENGSTKKYVIRIIVSEPYEVYPSFETNVEHLWTKTGSDMQLVFPGTGKGMTVSGNYLVFLDNHIDKNASAAIKLYNKHTGEFVKNINYYEGGWLDPRSYSWNLETDSEGHLVMGRLNSGGAGFMLDFYKHVDAVPSLFLNSVAGSDLPDNTGKRMNVVGNLLEGKAFVYASAAHYYGAVKQAANYAYWEFNDGKVTNVRPTVMSYAGAANGWYNAVIQRASVDDPTLYISWNNEDGYPNDNPDTWSSLHNINFHIFQPGSNSPALRIEPSNFGYRMLDSKVFKLSNGRFMAMLEQSYSTGGSMRLKMFNLSDPTLFHLKPGAGKHDKLHIFTSPDSGPTSNDGRFGHVTVGSISDDESIIYVYFPNPNPDLAKVEAYKLKVLRNN